MSDGRIGDDWNGQCRETFERRETLFVIGQILMVWTTLTSSCIGSNVMH